MAIVGEPYNANAHAKIPALFMSILWPRLCVHLYCTHWLWLYSCLSSLTDWSISSIQGTPHRHHTWHRHHTHRQSQMLTSGSPTKNFQMLISFKQMSCIESFYTGVWSVKIRTCTQKSENSCFCQAQFKLGWS